MELEALEGAALTLERQILTCEGLLNSKPLHVKRSGTLSKAIIGLRGNFYDFLFISDIERVHRKLSNDAKIILKFEVKLKLSANAKYSLKREISRKTL